MRNNFLRVLLCLVMAAALAAAATWQIDTAHSAAQFAVRHMMVSTVRGQFGGVRGTIEYDPAQPARAAVDVTIDANTLNTREAKRDAHLKSPDFFEVEKFPTITFKSKRVEPAGQGKLRLIGDLTMKGVTKEVALDVEGPTPEVTMRNMARIGASATGKVNRKDFGINWNRTLDAGGVVVGDEVSITIDVEMVRKLDTPPTTSASR